MSELSTLLHHKVHECRQTALLILVHQYQKGNAEDKDRIVKFYLSHKDRVNNWDLVDASAPYILGNWFLDKKTSGRKVLYKLANSKSIWDRRIAIVSTAAFIKKNQFKDTLNISKFLLKDDQDLIHKAVGWMLREVGNRSRETEEKFLNTYADVMPRTMLRYSIEKFPEQKRKRYLSMKM